MRHAKKTIKLGRKSEHRNALLATLVCSLIEHGRIRTTLAKAKAARPLAEKMVTLAKRGGLHARRTALATLHNNSKRTELVVGRLMKEVAEACAVRQGGYTRIVKLGERKSDAAPMAYLEWVDAPAVSEKKTSAKASLTTPAAPAADAAPEAAK